jgi:hypothetical protein
MKPEGGRPVSAGQAARRNAIIKEIKMASHYTTLPEPAAMPIPSLTGHFLARNQKSLIARAFFGADLHLGVKRLDKPTRRQAALLARVNSTYVWWAEQRMGERRQIEEGFIPLVPAVARTNGNGTAPPVVPDVSIDDAELMHIANLVGPDRMLAAAIAAGR